MSLYGLLSQMEDDRRRRRVEELKKRFDATIASIEEIRKAGAACYKAKKEIYESVKQMPKDLEKAKEAMMGEALPLGASKKERRAAKKKTKSRVR